MRIFYKIFQKGFSIIDVLVAIVIIGIGFTGILALMSRNIQLAQTTRNRTIATSLAREGVEIVRRTRDLNWYDCFANPDNPAYPRNSLGPTVINDVCLNWMVNLGDTSAPPDGIIDLNGDAQPVTYPVEYRRDTGSNNSGILLGSGDFVLKINNNRFEHTAGTPAVFSRQVTLDQDDVNLNIVNVTSTVTWTERGEIKNVTVAENLYNWYVPETP